jgi:hypothetical protein
MRRLTGHCLLWGWYNTESGTNITYYTPRSSIPELVQQGTFFEHSLNILRTFFEYSSTYLHPTARSKAKPTQPSNNMGFGKHQHNGHQNSTDKKQNKQQKQQQQKETTRPTLTHDGKLIVKKEGLRKGGAKKKSPNGDSDATKLVIKKQGLRGGGTPLSTSTIRSTSRSKSKAAVNANTNHNNHKSNKNENENENEIEIETATKTSSNADHEHDQYIASPMPTLVDDDRTASTTTTLAKALSFVVATFPDHSDDDGDNVGASATVTAHRRREKGEAPAEASLRYDNDNDNERSRTLLEIAQRERAADARRKEHIVKQQLQHYRQQGNLDMDYDDGTATHSSTTESTSSNRSTSGAAVWNDCIAELLMGAADCIEAFCSPAALRRKAACFDCTYGHRDDPTDDPDAEVYHDNERVYNSHSSFAQTYSESAKAYAAAGPIGTSRTSRSGTSTTNKQALQVPVKTTRTTGAANAGQHKDHSSAAASRRSLPPPSSRKNRTGAASLREQQLIEKRKEKTKLAKMEIIKANEDAIRIKQEQKQIEAELEKEESIRYQARQDEVLLRQREESELAEQARKQELQNKLLLEQQRKALKKRAEMDDIRARRAREATERKFRQNQLKKERQEKAELEAIQAKQIMEEKQQEEAQQRSLQEAAKWAHDLAERGDGTVDSSSITTDGDTTASSYLENDSHNDGNNGHASVADCVEPIYSSPSALREKIGLFEADSSTDPDADLYHERGYSHSFAQTFGEPARGNANNGPIIRAISRSRSNTSTKQALAPSILKTTSDAGQRLVSVASRILASSSSRNRSAAPKECLVEPQDKSFYTSYGNDSSTVGSSTVGSSTTGSYSIITGDSSTCLDDDTYNNDVDDERRNARSEAYSTSMNRSRNMRSMDRQRVLQ